MLSLERDRFKDNIQILFMKKLIQILLLCLLVYNVGAQIVRPFGVRYNNPSVRGNIVYVSNSSISTAGMGTGNPGTGEVAPAGTSKNNSAAGINIDIDNAPPVIKLPFNSVWNYHSNGAAPANNAGLPWTAPSYVMIAPWNVGASGTGTGPYGYNSSQNTCIPNGQALCSPPGGQVKYTAYYFRNTSLTFTATEL